jgi:geranylgeranyl pyrophosphate synthase
VASTSQRLTWGSAGQKRRIVGGMRRVEARLGAIAGAFPGRLGASSSATLGAGGKRLRPLLVLLTARRGAPLTSHVVRAAAAVELLHMATLVHDDVLDGAALRRGRPTVVSEAGLLAATSVGNYLFAGAFAEIAATGDARSVDRLSAVAAGLSEGELLQMEEAYDVSIMPEQYLRRCTLKTADLFAVSCGLGARLSGFDEESAVELEEFGRLLGLAFQIFDDILDFSGDAVQTGKHVGTDVKDGTVTLPLVYALQSQPDLQRLVADRAKDGRGVAEVVAAVRAGGALERSREAALAFVAGALERLDACKGDVEKDLLREVAGRVVDRYS